MLISFFDLVIFTPSNYTRTFVHLCWLHNISPIICYNLLNATHSSLDMLNGIA